MVSFFLQMTALSLSVWLNNGCNMEDYWERFLPWLIKTDLQDKVPFLFHTHLELGQFPFGPEDKKDTWKTAGKKHWTVMRSLSCRFNCLELPYQWVLAQWDNSIPHCWRLSPNIFWVCFLLLVSCKHYNWFGVQRLQISPRYTDTGSDFDFYRLWNYYYHEYIKDCKTLKSQLEVIIKATE